MDPKSSSRRGRKQNAMKSIGKKIVCLGVATLLHTETDMIQEQVPIETEQEKKQVAVLSILRFTMDLDQSPRSVLT